MFSVCVVGHIARDVNSFEGRIMPPRPGGTAYYAGMAYRTLGLSTAVVTRVRPEDSTRLLDEVRRLGVEVKCLASLRTSHFENHYPADSDERTQIVRSVADPFEGPDVAGVEARVFHFGPLLRDDIPAILFQAAKETSALSVLDAQGLVRTLRGDRVEPTAWSGDLGFLHFVDVLKGGERELCLLADEKDLSAAIEKLSAFGPEEILVTRGSRGSLVHCRNACFRLPAFRVAREVDTTGCGDTFTAGYVAQRLQSDDLEECARYAAALAAVKMEDFGPVRSGNLDARIRGYIEDPPQRAIPGGQGHPEHEGMR